MLFASGKFKYLERARELLSADFLPEFKKITGIDDISLIAPVIMRSALKNEASKKQLLSGKSLSIGGIDSRQKMAEAWTKISSQPELEEVLIQKEIPWGQHFTLIAENDFFFSEMRDRNGKSEFLYWSPLTQTSHQIQIEGLKKIISRLRPLIKESDLWLMELGEHQGNFHLFQVQPIMLEQLGDVFSNDLALRVVSSRQRFQKRPGLFSLLRTEWRALKFRKRKESLAQSPSSVFLNWEYIFHYFRIFCMLKGKAPTAEIFGQFLSETNDHNWITKPFKEHLEIANYLRKNEAFDPVAATFPHQGMVFIGKGKLKGTIGEDVLLLEQLSIAEIYGARNVRAILTIEISLLSHGVLAATENHIALVVGMDHSRFDALKAGDKVSLDFDNRTLEVN